MPRSTFPRFHARGDLPCAVQGAVPHSAHLVWDRSLAEVDCGRFLPLFFDGVRCEKFPCAFMARRGAQDLLRACEGDPARLLPVLPALVQPLRHAFLTFKRDVLVAALRITRRLVRSNDGVVAGALMPYAKTLFSPLTPHLHRVRRNLGDAMDHKEASSQQLASCVLRTLEVFERYGPPGAGEAIATIFPTYESCERALLQPSVGAFLGRGYFDGDEGSISMM